MKLYKALKLRKSLLGEITKIKKLITDNNSYLNGNLNSENCDVPKLYDELLKKIDELTGLKFAINEANREIQSKIYVIAEYKALIAFWNDIDITEGNKGVGYGETSVREYKVHVNETKRNEFVKEFQRRVDALQEELDEYNFTTEIPWDSSIE